MPLCSGADFGGDRWLQREGGIDEYCPYVLLFIGHEWLQLLQVNHDHSGSKRVPKEAAVESTAELSRCQKKLGAVVQKVCLHIYYYIICLLLYQKIICNLNNFKSCWNILHHLWKRGLILVTWLQSCSVKISGTFPIDSNSNRIRIVLLTNAGKSICFIIWFVYYLVESGIFSKIWHLVRRLHTCFESVMLKTSKRNHIQQLLSPLYHMQII